MRRSRYGHAQWTIKVFFTLHSLKYCDSSKIGPNTTVIYMYLPCYLWNSDFTSDLKILVKSLILFFFKRLLSWDLTLSCLSQVSEYISCTHAHACMHAHAHTYTCQPSWTFQHFPGLLTSVLKSRKTVAESRILLR